VDSIPENANIHLSNTTTVYETPISLSGLIPDRYQLQVEHEGYTSWDREIEIRAGQTTFADSIVLYPIDKPTTLFEGNITTFAQATNGNTAFIEKIDAKTERLVSIRGGEIIELETNIPTSTATEYTLTFSKDGNTLFWKTTTNKTTSASLFNISTGEKSVFQTTNTACKKIIWNPETTQIICQDDFLDAIAWHETFLVLTRDGSHNTISTLGNSEILANTPREFEQFCGQTDTILCLTDIRKSTTFLINNKNPENLRILSFPLTQIITTTNSEIITAWNNHELYTFYPTTLEYTFITRISDTITNALAVAEDRSIIYTTPNGIFAIENVPLDDRFVTPLHTDQSISNTIINEERILFIGHSDKSTIGIMSKKIL
jgi:hypothetical protein